MHLLFADLKREQSRSEEIANSVSHGIGLVAALAGAPVLIRRAAQEGDDGFAVSAGIFSATMVLLYLASMFYHALPMGKAKGVLRAVEHSAIFLLIAGTYTPFTLGVLRGPWGWTIFGVVWGLAIAGVVLKTVEVRPHPVFSTSLCLFMGWIIVVAIDPLFSRMPREGIFWLFSGGLSYSAGVVFYVTDAHLRYGHLIWHLLVMAGTTCHYCAVLWYAAS
ncbi:hemolysin III family protein [Comamonas humi]